MFYEIEIQRNKDNVESKGMYSYNTRDEAIAVFHTKMASGITAGRAGNLNYVLTMVINEAGTTVALETWTAPEPEPNEE